MHRLVGSVLLGKYRLVEHIAGGGMGHVFRAERQDDGTRVAVKVVHRELAASDDVVRRLYQEAGVLRTLNHPNVVRLLDADTSEHGPCIVMEYLEGHSAGALLAHVGRLDEAAVISLAVPVLAALHATHLAGVIHRDLKPDNLFVCRVDGSDGLRHTTVKLLDFGIAKVEQRTEGAPRTNTGVVFGTPDYLSPEQATAELPLDGRSDLFALGIVLFELLSGRRPFTASNAVATAFRIVHGTPEALESLGVSVGPGLEAVLGDMLAKSRTDRPATAADAQAAFEALMPDADAREARLARLLDVADERRRRSTRPPISPRSFGRTQAGISFEASASDRRFARDAGLAPKASGRSVRGPMLRSLDAAIEAIYGEGGRERVVALMPDDHASELRRGRPSPLDAHDDDALKLYADIASRILRIDEAGFHALGRHAADDELATLVPTLIRSAPLPDVAARAISILGRLFEFGTWSIKRAEPSRVNLQAEGVELVPPFLRAFFAGVLERVFEHASGRPVTVVDTSPSGRTALYELEATIPT